MKIRKGSSVLTLSPSKMQKLSEIITSHAKQNKLTEELATATAEAAENPTTAVLEYKQ